MEYRNMSIRQREWHHSKVVWYGNHMILLSSDFLECWLYAKNIPTFSSCSCSANMHVIWQTHSHLQALWVSSWPNQHVVGLWEETWRHGEQTWTRDWNTPVAASEDHVSERQQQNHATATWFYPTLLALTHWLQFCILQFSQAQNEKFKHHKWR